MPIAPSGSALLLCLSHCVAPSVEVSVLVVVRVVLADALNFTGGVADALGCRLAAFLRKELELLLPTSWAGTFLLRLFNDFHGVLPVHGRVAACARRVGSLCLLARLLIWTVAAAPRRIRMAACGCALLGTFLPHPALSVQNGASLEVTIFHTWGRHLSLRVAERLREALAALLRKMRHYLLQGVLTSPHGDPVAGPLVLGILEGLALRSALSHHLTTSRRGEGPAKLRALCLRLAVALVHSAVAIHVEVAPSS
mmetsp:Transcript_76006/g.171862  ORF Transcript_76006/g.171862 Transcript_76006/m.171862 type:complete len:254 (+) Transcript_76006:319-1080(+)